MNKPTYPCDANHLRGQQTRLLAVEIVADYRRRQSANHGPDADRAANGPQSGIVAPVLIAGRDQVTPPLLTDRERGEGESTNARMHKLIGKYRDFALVLTKRY